MKTEHFFKEELPKIREMIYEANKNDKFSLHLTFPKIDLYLLLNHLNCEKIFYFKSKYGDFTFLGLGHSANIKGQDLNLFLKKHTDQFVAASFSFEGSPLNADVELPEWIFVNRGEETELIINKSSEYNEFSLPNLFFNTSFDLNLYDPLIPPWESYEEVPERDHWAAIIEACNQLFSQGELEKIVMSRKKIFGYSEPIDQIAFFKAVMEKNHLAQTSYAIFKQTNFGQSFISLTPEKLFSVAKNTFESIALAASAPRGATAEEDAEFEKLLNTSEKLIREHNLVTEEIVKKLSAVCDSIEVMDLQTMKLPYIQHRSVPIKAQLKNGIGPIDLLELLHPTPAVGGLPTEKARAKISELEPYVRHQYAAPIGVIGQDFCELAVGIRSALVENTKLTLFGGAGIVMGSIAEEEWNETNTKMNPFLKVVNNE